MYCVCPLSVRNWLLSPFNILYIPLHVLCVHLHIAALLLTHSLSQTHAVIIFILYHLQSRAHHTHITHTLNEFELNDFCCRKAVSSCAFMLYVIYSNRVVISTKQFYVMIFTFLIFITLAKGTFFFFSVWIRIVYMCQTLYVHVFDIFIVLCLHVCRYTVSYIHTIMSMCRRKNNTLNAHLRTLPTIISYDLFVLCISLLVDIMISYIKYKK